MVKFEWSYGNEFIWWRAIWDGRFDNDPLVKQKLLKSNQKCYFHPFRKTIDYKETELSKQPKRWRPEYGTAEEIREVGDIASDNKVTRALCEILSDDEKIKAASGYTCPYWYREILLECLSLL